MAEKTEISWCDSTFNGWWSCTQISPGCDNCFAKTLAARFGYGWNGAPMRLFGDAHWQQPLKWAKTMPAKLGRRPRVFSMSMGDWLDLDAPLDQFVRLLDTIRLTPELDWQLLSKRIGNWRKRLEEGATYRLAVVLADMGDATRDPLWQWIKHWLAGHAPSNVWLGATVIDQAEADRDIPKLLAVPARVRFLSIEPMLSAMDLSVHLNVYQFDEGSAWSARNFKSHDTGLHWLIGGFESGPHARPGHIRWARQLRDQAEAAGVAFHWKQFGEWAPALSGMWFDPLQDGPQFQPRAAGKDTHDFGEGYGAVRIGKAAAGRLLDGRTHDEFPQPKGAT